MEQKILPITEPLIKNYPQHAFYLSIISNKEECLPWIFSNYTNIYLSNWKNEWVFMDYFVQTPEHHFHPWFKDSQRLHRDLILNTNIEFISFLKQQINSEYYVWLHVDEYYIPQTYSYNKSSFSHAIFVYGYEDKTKTFKIMAFHEDGKYAKSEVEYLMLKQAFLHCEAYDSYLNYIHLLKINPEIHNGKTYGFDISIFFKDIKDYYESKNIMENYKNFYDISLYDDRTFGLNIYIELKKHFIMHLDKKINVDIRLLYTLYEHKKFMNMKLEYIQYNGYYNFNHQFIEGYRELEKEVRILLNIYLKYKFTNNKVYIEKVIKKLESIHFTEKNLLSSLFKPTEAL
ncbi:hypothetical protein MKY19_06970 [Paenibacillus sp. FSL R5-0744]|uniref:hypothetical protein n=1 Tax=Paenibacillus sp. FSL R5-0744 TaxID=2921656 RepID=UPI0030DD0305